MPPKAQYLGDISYSCYLWHWPLIIFYIAWAGRNPGAADGLLLIALTLALSHFTKVQIEDRFRYGAQRAKSYSPLRIGLASVGACLIAAMAIWLAASPTFSPTLASATHPGARALTENIPVQGGTIVPSLATVKADMTPLSKGCHANKHATIAEGCVFGATDGPLRVALVGDSHAAHWFPALHAVTEERGWRLTAYTKSACAFVPKMLGAARRTRNASLGAKISERNFGPIRLT